MFGRQKHESIHYVVVQVLKPDEDFLQRTALLHSALMKAISGTTIVRHIKSDLKAGRIEVIVRGETVCPRVESGSVRVDVSPASRLTG